MMKFSLKSLLFPPKCVFCGAILDKNEFEICEKCKREVRLCGVPHAVKKPNYIRAFSVYRYEGRVRTAIHRFKFKGKLSACAHFGRMMAIVWNREGINADLITHPPSHRFKSWRKGYDHAKMLAQTVAKELSLPEKELLKKVRRTKPMYGLHESERRANLLGSMAFCGKKEELCGKTVLLVDDILTTGTTASESARILMENGAKAVYVLTAAAKK